MTPQSLYVIFVSDRARAVLPEFSVRGIEITWIEEPVRRGKPSAINAAMALVKTPVVIFHDANTELHPNSINEVCIPFSNSAVGGVAGEKRVRIDSHTPAALEGLYWRYESAWKKRDAQFFSVVGGAGELFAMRTVLFDPLPEDCLLDDLELSWQVIQKGCRIAYAASAITTENPSSDLREESNRKIRIAAGAYQFLDRHSLLSIFRVSVRYGIQFLIRKWLRWVAWPILTLLMPPALFAFAYYFPTDACVRWLFYCMGGIYGLALVGGLLSLSKVRVGWLGLPFYFLFVQYCQVRGWLRYRFGKSTVRWEKSDRSSGGQQQ